MLFAPGFDHLDPALLAFVKCHITSPLKWEALRVLASQEGTWLRTEQLARATHRTHTELHDALAQLVAEGVLEELPAGQPEDVSYRLPPSEPTSIVLQRLIQEATRSQELRSIIVAYLQRSKVAATLTPSVNARAVA
jgi:hypothetical protein